MIGCLQTRVCKQPIVELHFEFENELKFYNLGARAVVYNALFGPRFRVYRDCFDSLSDRRSNERCEGAGKTAVSWVCELLYSQSRVGVVGSQLFRAAGNTETGFSNLISIAFITAWQSFIKEGACQG